MARKSVIPSIRFEHSLVARRVRVGLDCEAKYRNEDDPWGIGDADSRRYDLYVESIRERARAHGSVLDIGCGFGAMLARLRSDFERLHGIELSAEAIAKGAERYPFIEFEQGSIDALERTRADRERFDAIIFSDVIYYVEESHKRAALRWIAEHLNRDGFAFIAAYSPGGREYLTPIELRTLVERELAIEREERLDSGHVMLLARARRRLVAMTLDYETWQPVPAGRRIDWEADVFGPTDRLLDAFDAEGACLTIFAELGEHAFLREYQPELAERMESQWREAIRRGHNVEIHLHPNWLPELGARLENGDYVWNELLTRADEHPDLVALVARLKRTLAQAIGAVDPTYEVTAFRAGGYEAQPFRRLAEALRANDILCDSSVYRGGRQPGIYHDYDHPVDAHQPWFASHADPQLEAPPAERGIVELPVATFARNDRWTFDGDEGAHFGERLIAAIEAERTAGPSTETARAIASARELASAAYEAVRSRWGPINYVFPRTVAHALVDYRRERVVEDDFHVAVGHSKADLDIPAIREQLRILRESGVEVVGLAEMARLAREQLERHAPLDCTDSPSRQIQEHERLAEMIPLDRAHVLELDRVEEARSARSISALSFADGTFDCVHAGTVLQRALDVDAALREVRRVLVDGGALVAAIRPDAYNTRRRNGKLTWRTSAADVRERMAQAGFVDIAVEQTDTYRRGFAPYPPASDRMLYVRAWRRPMPLAPAQRVDALRKWASTQLDPVHRSASAVTRLLGEALAREGFKPRWATMIARDHPAGHGPCLYDTHEVIELTFADRSVHVIDPVADVRFPCALQTLIEEPAAADRVVRGREPSSGTRTRDLYATSFWYRRVVAVAVRGHPHGARHFVPVRWVDRASDPLHQGLAVVRARAWRTIRWIVASLAQVGGSGTLRVVAESIASRLVRATLWAI
jgi:SAM-dependent methyltransferase